MTIDEKWVHASSCDCFWCRLRREAERQSYEKIENLVPPIDDES